MENKKQKYELENFVGQITQEDAVSLVNHMGYVFYGNIEGVVKVEKDNNNVICSIFITDPLNPDYISFTSYALLKDFDLPAEAHSTDRLLLFLQWMADRFPAYLENYEKYSDMTQDAIMEDAKARCNEQYNIESELYWYKEKQKPLPGYYEFTGYQSE